MIYEKLTELGINYGYVKPELGCECCYECDEDGDCCYDCECECCDADCP